MYEAIADVSEITVKRLENPEPIKIYPLIKQLHPELTYPLFYQYFMDMRNQNYFMIAAYDQENIIAMTGCWVATKFYCGRYLLIDSFVVDEHYRNQAVGSKIMDSVLTEAKRLKCDSVTLNAYLWNGAAQRFYGRYQFATIGHHMVLNLGA